MTMIEDREDLDVDALEVLDIGIAYGRTYAGSGRAYHLAPRRDLALGRIRRKDGDPLCGKRFAEFQVLIDRQERRRERVDGHCPGCREMAARFGLDPSKWRKHPPRT
jgi:hypothetical protein